MCVIRIVWFQFQEISGERQKRTRTGHPGYDHQTMSISDHPCKRDQVEHVRKFLASLKSQLNETRYYPPTNAYRYMVALGLYSKSITTAESILVLIEAGYSDEAFGMTRTLVDIFITLHYIANNDTEARAKKYAQFSAKDSEVWSEVIKIYWPQNASTIDPATKRRAAAYPSPHQWSGRSVKDMALEPDSVEIDPSTGRPAVHDFAYRVIYRWTSHYVHPTVVALQNHLVQAGRDNFVVRKGDGPDMSHLALFSVGSYVVNTLICFFRCMGDPQPPRLSRWGGALVAHLARRHS